MAVSKTTKGKKNTSTQNNEQKRRNEILENEKRKRHIWSVILFAAGILFLVFSFVGSIDTKEPDLGDYIHRLFFGLLGVSTFLAGPLIIYIAINLASDKCKTTLSVKLIQLGLLFLIVTAAVQIIFFGQIEADGFFDIVGQTYSDGKMLKSSGVLGLILGLPLLLFGEVAARIIIILIIFVIIMITMNISLISFLRVLAMPFGKLVKGTNKTIRKVKEENRIIKEERSRYADDEIYEAEEIFIPAQPEPKKYISPGGDKNDILLEIERAKKFSSIESATNSVRNLNQNDIENDEEIHSVGEVSDVESNSNGLSQSAEMSISPYFPDEENVEDEEIAVIFKHSTEPEKVTEDTAEKTEEEKKNAVIEAIDAFNEEGGVDISGEPEEIKTELAGEENIQENVDSNEVIEKLALQYTLPPVVLLNDIVEERNPKEIEAELQTNATTLTETLKSFGVQTKIVGICRGPSVTRYEIQPAAGVKISKITNLVDDISLNLASAGVRIEAPIPNKAAVGIEVPNKQVDTVPFRSLVDSEMFWETKSKLGAVIGKNISGEIIVADIAKMPHTLIAGTTGSGKSVCVNSIIMSILFRSTPDEVRLLMIDPKAVEFMIYNGIPHLLIPVVTDPKKAAGALGWAVTEMLNRYKMFSDNNVRDLTGFNSLAKGNPDIIPMPQIVIFIDELADLMMASPGEVEDSICRLAQMARAAGMHLVIATQRPSVNVVTGVIKANIPSRIALKVASQVDSRTIIDSAGAEKLLGKGDMLYYPVGAPKPMRVQGCWVSDKEVDRVVNFIKNSFALDYDESVIEEIDRQAELSAANEKGNKSSQSGDIDSSDEKLEEAIQAVVEAGQASTSYLQRKLKLGYGRAARLIDIMEEMGIVGPFEGSKPRQIIMTKQEWLERKMNEK